MTDAELRDQINGEASSVIDWLRPVGKSLPTEYPLLTPAFVADVQVIAEQYDAYQGRADNEVWKLALRVIAEWMNEYKAEAVSLINRLNELVVKATGVRA